VLGAILGREPQVLVEPVADVVPIEDVGAHTAFPEVLLELDGDGGLAGAGEAGQPDGRTLVSVELLPVTTGHRALMPDDVGRLLLCHGACPLQAVRTCGNSCEGGRCSPHADPHGARSPWVLPARPA